MNLFSYIRVSGKGQVAKEGPDRQREAIVDFAIKAKATLRGEFFDKAVSGTIDGLDRPAFKELLEAIESRRLNGEEIDGIVVERADRLARDLIVGELLLKECRERNIKVFSADRGETVDLASDDVDPTRVLIRQLMSAMAQWEKSNLVRRLRKAREAVKLRTGRCGGRAPIGVDKREQLMLEFLRGVYSPELSYRQLTALVSDAGFCNRAGNDYNVGDIFRQVNKLKQKGLV